MKKLLYMAAVAITLAMASATPAAAIDLPINNILDNLDILNNLNVAR
ncbi:hypothetical protein [Nonomuraea dietziae]